MFSLCSFPPCIYGVFRHTACAVNTDDGNYRETRCPKRGSVPNNVKHLVFKSSMGAGKPIPECVQWIVVRLSTCLSVEEICMYADISKSSVDRILAHFRRTGTVPVHASRSQHRFRKALCDKDVEVSCQLSLCTLD